MSSDRAEFMGAVLRISCLEVVVVGLLKAIADKDPEMVGRINDIKAMLEKIDNDVVDKFEGYDTEDLAVIKGQGKTITELMTNAGL